MFEIVDHSQSREAVLSLIQKAGQAELPSEAMHFSQAAVNAANALTTLESLQHLQFQYAMQTGQLPEIPSGRK